MRYREAAQWFLWREYLGMPPFLWVYVVVMAYLLTNLVIAQRRFSASIDAGITARCLQWQADGGPVTSRCQDYIKPSSR